MLCFEISINGQLVCVAGNPNERRLSVDVYRNRNDTASNIFVAGDSYNDNDWSERFIWGNQRLNVGDQVVIKVVESERPDLPIETHNIKANKESETVLDSIVKQVASLWLDHLLRGEPLPFPAKERTSSSALDEHGKRFCAFCGKNQDAVKKLISSPGEACICNECIGVCVEILDDKPVDAEPGSTPAPLARWPVRG